MIIYIIGISNVLYLNIIRDKTMVYDFIKHTYILLDTVVLHKI